MNSTLTFQDIAKAAERLKGHIKNTPIITNEEINQQLGARVFFKMENHQVTNSFKARGVFNALFSYREKNGNFPNKIVATSSGNHGQAVAYAGKQLGIPVLVYMISAASQFKMKKIRDLGAEIITKDSRSEIEQLAKDKQKDGYVLIHPSADADIICGQATSAFEALNEIGEVDAIFTPCGGGGLVSGTFLAAQGLSAKAQVFPCEPELGNDTAISFRQGKIFAFEDSPKTIADGARTLSTSEICFQFIKQMSDVLEISEEKIIEWQKKLSEILQQKIEPTSALAIAGCEQYLRKNVGEKNQKILVIISGGNLE